MIRYIGYWLTTEVHEKKRRLDVCCRLTKEALRAFEKERDTEEYCRTCNQLSTSTILGFFLEWEFTLR